MDNSGRWLPNQDLLWQCGQIFAAEVAIDVAKHAVVGKFNEIRPGVYREFMKVSILTHVNSYFACQDMSLLSIAPANFSSLVTSFVQACKCCLFLCDASLLLSSKLCKLSLLHCVVLLCLCAKRCSHRHLSCCTSCCRLSMLSVFGVWQLVDLQVCVDKI